MININTTVQTKSGLEVTNPVAFLNPSFRDGGAIIVITYYKDVDAIRSGKESLELVDLPKIHRTDLTVEEFFGQVMMTLHNSVATRIEEVTGAGTTTLNTVTEI